MAEMRSINLGCGDEPIPGSINIDFRDLETADLRADVLRLPFRGSSIDEVIANSILEHFANPCKVLDEVHRVLSDDGTLRAHMPALGSNSAHLDPTHRFLGDLLLWQTILEGYFESVRIGSVGVKYRHSPLLVLIQRLGIWVLGFHEFGQCWTFKCRRKRVFPERRFAPWWLAEESPSRPRRDLESQTPRRSRKPVGQRSELFRARLQ